MVEENKLTSNLWLGRFKIETNLTVEQVKARFESVTSHKTLFITLENQEVCDNPDNFMYMGNIDNNKLYLYNLNSTIAPEKTILHGSFNRVNNNTVIKIWARPVWFYILLSTLFPFSLLYISITKYQNLSEILLTMLLPIGWIIFMYIFYLFEVSKQKETLKKLFKFKK